MVQHADSNIQVLRWSALALGVVYGFSHQSSISARDKAAAAQAEFDRKANLISQAKQEWTRQHSSPSTPSAGGNSSTSILFSCNFET